jgi:hypothetical protein
MCDEPKRDYAKPYTKDFYEENGKHHWERRTALGGQVKARPRIDKCCDLGDQVGGCKGKGFNCKQDAQEALCALEEKERAESLESK